MSAMGCQSRPPTMEFVLPDGYRGKVFIYVDPVNGVRLDPYNGYIRIDIPTSGVLGIRDDAVLSRWHTVKARYVNGTVIPYEPNGVGRTNDPLFIDGDAGTNDGVTVHWFYVGTRSDYSNQVGIASAEKEFARQTIAGRQGGTRDVSKD